MFKVYIIKQPALSHCLFEIKTRYISCTNTITISAITEAIAAPTPPKKCINIILNIIFVIAPIVTEIVNSFDFPICIKYCTPVIPLNPIAINIGAVAINIGVTPSNPSP